MINLEDDRLKNVPSFIKKMVARKFNAQGIVQFQKKGSIEYPTICGDSVLWLDDMTIETTSEKRANKFFFEYLKNKYPHYGEYLQLF